jgi:hypothetical protein
VAHATPPIPILTGTSPGSPNTDLSPFVHGNSTGSITSSLPPGRLSAVGASAETAGRTIDLYLSQACEGAAVAFGTADQLDTDGIQIGVQPEATTFISAKQTDVTGTSDCSNSISYQHVRELPQPGPPGSGSSTPPAPPHLRTIPGGWANDNTPLVTGSAPNAASVKIFTNSRCDGAPVAKGSAAQFDSGLEVQVVDNVAIAFYGISVALGGAQSRCSAPVFYIEDSLTPHTRITMGPASKTRKRTAVFRFTDTTGDARGTTFFCKVDRGKWKRCSSPLRLRRLGLKRHTVRVRATDAAGNAESRGAKRRFKVVPRP